MADSPTSHRRPGGGRWLVAAILLPTILLLSSGILRLIVTQPAHEDVAGDSSAAVALRSELRQRFDEYRNAFADSCQLLVEAIRDDGAISRFDSLSAGAIFTHLARHNAPECSFEVYGADLSLIGWVGPESGTPDEFLFGREPADAILQGPIYTYYTIVLPIIRNDSLLGYLNGKTLFDVRYPLSNRFISNALFQSTFTSKIDGGLSVQVLPAGERDSTEGFVSVPVSGLSGKELAMLVVPVPAAADAKERVTRVLANVEAVMWLMLVVVLGLVVYRFSRNLRSRTWRLLTSLVLVWMVRFTMIWLGIPSGLIGAGMFDPFYFASTFGFGLAQSAGDALISSLFLLATIVSVAGTYLSRWKEPDTAIQRYGAGGRIVVPIVLVVFAGVAWTLLRGVAATIRSTVMDTTLSFTDPSMIVPPPVLGTLLLTAAAVSIAYVIALWMMLLESRLLVQRAFDHRGRIRHTGLIVVLLFGIASWGYGVVHPNPLTGDIERLVILLSSSVVAFLPAAAGSDRGRYLRRWWGLGAIALTVVLLRYDAELREFDRSRVELIAEDISKPVDAWLSFVVGRALDEMSAPPVVRTLFNGSQEDIDKLAFTSWAGSILSREGLNCAVLVIDYDGNPVSEFRVGAGPSQTETQFESSSHERSVVVEEREGEGGRNVWYVGYTPLYSGSGTPMGGIRIDVSANRKVFLRGEAPEILRNYGRDDRRLRERQLIFSEYAEGQLIATTSEVIPRTRYLPEAVLRTQSDDGVWLVESDGGQNVESYYFHPRGSGDRSTTYALSMQERDLQWRVYVALRMLVPPVGCLIACLLLVFGVRALQRRPPRMSFRTKVLLTFVIVSVGPLAILTMYNREYAVERAERMMLRTLSDESSRVVNILQREYAVQTPFDLARIRDQECTDIAQKASTDFNVYASRELLASSRPEVFVSELIDRRLSAPAYRAVVIDRREFFSEHLSIGTLEYVVGYRPLVSAAGDAIGVVAVHTLYRQTEADNEAAMRNSFLLGAYAISCLIALALGLWFSRRISAPIRNLQLATRSIAAGDLSVRTRSRRSDELGELENAFDAMAGELKQRQEQLLRTERELAWREMAKQVAHEIKNPLTPMRLSVQHLQRAYADGAREFGDILTHVSRVLLEQIDTLSRIATEFSRFARMPDRKPEICRIHDLLDEVTSLFSHHAGLTITSAYGADQSSTMADREELRRAFINIFRNAVQAMNEQGTITVETRSSDTQMEVSITDNGPGIAEEMKPHLFKPNFSTKTEGMGLGLAIVKKTIEDLRGEIHIESSTGGTTVRVVLPLHAGGVSAQGGGADGR